MDYETDNRPWNSKERQMEYLAESVKPSTVVYTRQTNGRGETDYLEIYVADGRNKIRNLTWETGRALGYAVRERENRWFIPMSGGFYNKGTQIYHEMRRALGHKVDGEMKHETL